MEFFYDKNKHPKLFQPAPEETLNEKIKKLKQTIAQLKEDISWESSRGEFYCSLVRELKNDQTKLKSLLDQQEKDPEPSMLNRTTSP